MTAFNRNASGAGVAADQAPALAVSSKHGVRKLAYIVYHDCSADSGVLKKIASQMTWWRAAGVEAELFIASPSVALHPSLRALRPRVFERRGRVGYSAQTRTLVDAVLRWAPEIAYLRFSTYYPGLGRLLAQVPTVFEVNTNDLVEYRQRLAPWKYAAHRLLRRRLLRSAAGFVAVTEELGRMFPEPSAIIANGLDLGSYEPLPPTRNATINAVFVGSENLRWHGVDKILELATLLPSWHFEIVGYSAEDFREAMPPNVAVHGYLPRAEYVSILARADVALGTLALHRKRMEEASPLKVREYLAAGLPTIIAYHDTDFPEPVPFLLQLPNTPHNVKQHCASIQDFGRRWLRRRLNRDDITHLDIGWKEMKRLTFLADVLHGARRKP